jgi:hypothetical protein
MAPPNCCLRPRRRCQRLGSTVGLPHPSLVASTPMPPPFSPASATGRSVGEDLPDCLAFTPSSSEGMSPGHFSSFSSRSFAKAVRSSNKGKTPIVQPSWAALQAMTRVKRRRSCLARALAQVKRQAQATILPTWEGGTPPKEGSWQTLVALPLMHQ